MLINPYETTLGSLENSEKLTVVLSKFLIEADQPKLSYEYLSPEDIKLCFITGKDQEEKDLPTFNHPIIFLDHRGKKHLFVDVRTFVNAKDNLFTKLADVVKDSAGLEFTIIRVIYMLQLESDNKGSLNEIQKNIAIGFSYWITNMIGGSLFLTPEEKTRLGIVALHYYFGLIADEEIDDNNLAIIINKILRSGISFGLSYKYIESIIKDLNHNPKNSSEFAANIAVGVASQKTNGFDNNLLFTMLQNSWYGPNSSENIGIALEHVPTWIAMMFVSIDNRTFTKTRLANIMMEKNKIISTKDFAKKVALKVKENQLV